MPASTGRHAKGANFIDLIRFVKNYEKTHVLPPLSYPARALMNERIRGTEWYHFEPLQELMALVDKLVIKGDEGRALEMGAAGGASLRGLQNTYAVAGDPLNSVVAMRHAWRAHYDFGVLTGEITDDHTVQFRISEYPDLPMVHALFTAGWGIAAARGAGSASARLVIRDRPWRGATSFLYEIHV